MPTGSLLLKRTPGLTTYSEEQMITELDRYERPISEVSFKTNASQISHLSGVRVGNLLVTEAYSDSMVSKTKIDPHLTFVIPIAGSGTIVEQTRTTRWSASRRIFSFSFARPMMNDNDGMHWMFFRPSFDALLKAIDAKVPGSIYSRERILESWTTVYAGRYDRIDYYGNLRTLLAIVDNADGDEEFLSRIGIEDIFNELFAELIIARERHKDDDEPIESTSRSARSVDIICDHIKANVGTPLTTPRMEALTGLTGRALGYAFQHRFGCSPHRWQRNYLLDEARRLLLDRQTVKSVKTICYDLGFSSANSFAAHYRNRFGELPTTTRNSLATINSPSKSRVTEN